MGEIQPRWIAVGVVLVCLGFALKTLALIDAITLGSDEIYSLGMRFQAKIWIDSPCFGKTANLLCSVRR